MHSTIRRQLVPVLLVAAVSSTALAQNHLLVPSQFAEIGTAVQAASPGDVIEVTERLQPYLPFVIDRTVTIVGAASENNAPRVALTAGATVGIDIQLTTGERATLSRIDVYAAPGASAAPGMRIVGGSVALEDCRLRSADDLTSQVAVVEASNTELATSFCRFEGGRGGTALRATNSRVSLTATRCFGGTMPSGDGVALIDSTLHATEAWLLGGEDFVGGPGGVALRVTGASQATLHLGTAAGGMGQPGGNGLVNTSANPVEFAGQVFAGGLDLTTLSQAAATVGATTANPNLAGLTWSEPIYRRGTLQPGQPWAVSARATPNTIALLAFSFAPTGTAPLITRQPALLPQDLALLEAVVTSPIGYGTFGGVTPANPALRGVTLWAQAVALGPLPLEASPASAVVVR